jgi:pimeloyl-ACP methyl ester carboxylesterase
MQSANGLQVYTYGSKDNQAIVFLHGFVYDSSMWDKQIEALKDDFYCVAFDIRGMGKSIIGDGIYTMEMLADDLFDVIKELELTNPVVCGLSMGGYITFTALAMNSSIFKAAIICDSRASADNNTAKEKRANTIKKINSEGLAPYLDDFIPLCFGNTFKQQNPQQFQAYIDKAKTFDPLGVKGCTVAMKGRIDTTALLSSRDMPFLVICGENDILSPPDEMKAMAELIPNADFVIVPDSGHMTPIENPGFVNDHIKAFLNKL